MHLVALWSPTPADAGVDGPRFGLTVSRKVGNAVIRNRVKRWLREAVRRRRSAVGPLDVVFVARSTAASAGYAELSAEVDEVLARLSRERV